MKSLEQQLNEIIQAWDAEFTGKAIISFKEAAEFTTDLLHRTSPKDTGDYSKGWTWDEKSNVSRSRTGVWSGGNYIVFNDRDWQLTHLLEKGHANPTAGPGKLQRTPARPHIKPAEQEGIKDLVRRLYENL